MCTRSMSKFIFIVVYTVAIYIIANNYCNVFRWPQISVLTYYWNGFFLFWFSVIMLDEAHERTLYTDIAIGLLKKVRALYYIVLFPLYDHWFVPLETCQRLLLLKFVCQLPAAVNPFLNMCHFWIWALYSHKLKLLSSFSLRL